MLAQVKADILQERFSHSMLGAIDTITAEMMTKAGDLDGAIALLDAVFDNNLWNSGEGMWALTTGVLVDALLARGADGDLERAEAAVDRMAEFPIARMTAMAMQELRMRAVIARAKRDEKAYRALADEYLAKATSFGFHGHAAAARAMT